MLQLHRLNPSLSLLPLLLAHRPPVVVADAAPSQSACLYLALMMPLNKHPSLQPCLVSVQKLSTLVHPQQLALALAEVVSRWCGEEVAVVLVEEEWMTLVAEAAHLKWMMQPCMDIALALLGMGCALIHRFIRLQLFHLLLAVFHLHPRLPPVARPPSLMLQSLDLVIRNSNSSVGHKQEPLKQALLVWA